MICVLYFARLREHMGREADSLVWDESIRTLEDVRQRLGRLYPDKNRALGARDLLVARNGEMAGWDDTVADGDEVALFPPVTGG